MEISTVSNADRPRPSVEVRKAYKCYSHDVAVLKGLNMTVPTGKIYALLGSSGCGKSTLLNCIIGRCSLDSGTIILKVDQRSSVGFMPQDLCLYKDLSIHENMLVFGYLAGLKKDRIIARGDELIRLFQLPQGDTYVKTLSGGQQRRVSMLIAFLHDPEIVILDEPTVGLDVTLTQIVWEYFLRQAASGKTIIITTHYIQEAYRAHTAGILRNGVLIAEDDPHTMMERHESSNLEDVFLKMSAEQQERKKSRRRSTKESDFPSYEGQFKQPYFTDDNKKLNGRRLKGILYKDIIQLSRNYTFIISMLIIPIIQITLFHFTYGSRPKEVKIGFVKGEIAIHDCNYTSYAGCFISNKSLRLSCIYMDLFRNSTYKLIEYVDEGSAVRAVKKNDVWAAVHFPENYTQSAVTVFRNNGTKIPLEKITAWVDSSSTYVGTMVKEDMFRYYIGHWEAALNQCDASLTLLSYGRVSFQPPLNIAGDVDTAMMSSSISSMLILISIALSSASTAVNTIEERVAGTLVRMQIGGLSVHEFAVSLFVVQIGALLVRIFCVLSVYFWILGYVQRGSFFYVTLLVFSAGFLGILLGLISSVITTSPTVTMMIQNAFSYVITLCSGLMWPIEGQPAALRFLNTLLPVSSSVRAMKGLTLQGLSITNEIVLEGFGMVLAWTAILTLLVGLMLRYRTDALFGK